MPHIALLNHDSPSVLPRSFYETDAPLVAKELLGKLLVRRLDNNLLVGRIVETEAYLGKDDPAAHSFIGQTARNSVLFGEAGHAYVHAMRQHYLMDIVAEFVNEPGSVLLRAIEPIESIDVMKETRRSADIKSLTNGPAKLCQALQIDKRFNGVDVTTSRSELFVCDDGYVVRSEDIIESKRIGISKATELLLRFYIKSAI